MERQICVFSWASALNATYQRCIWLVQLFEVVSMAQEARLWRPQDRCDD